MVTQGIPDPAALQGMQTTQTAQHIAGEPVIFSVPLGNAEPLALARQLVKESGGRNTGARRKVLACLIAAERALSHADIEAQLADTDLDRVTLYRVLDWLVDHALAHRVGGLSGFDRAMRFAFSRPQRQEAHAHFQCVRCGTTMCLDEVAVPKLPVADGIQLQGVELAAYGYCEKCGIEIHAEADKSAV
jgi:Fur family ferric uptake transcriptional regulator